MKTSHYLFPVLVALIFQGCHRGLAQDIRLVPVEMSQPINGILNLITTLDSLTAGDNRLNFETIGFELGAPTISDRAQLLANSERGQYIHVILDDQPYMAKYDKNFSVALTPGDHTLVAFLSRSYHESLKNRDASIWMRLNVNDTEVKNLPVAGPQLIYSRPKGNYQMKANGQTPVLLDFYLLNTDLSDGHFVMARIDDKEFRISSWKPHYIHGLDVGVHRVSLQLMDEEGRPVPGPTNYSGERVFKIIKH